MLDDDYRVREALTSLLSSVGLRVEVFASAAEYLKFQKPDSPVKKLEYESTIDATWLRRPILAPDRKGDRANPLTAT